MNKNRIPGFIIIFVISAFFLLSCEIKTADVNLGSLLSTDENGFFTEKEIYCLDDEIHTFDSDGSYEYFRYDTDGTQDYGRKGNYNWNPSTFLLTLEYTSEYNSSSASWESYESVVSYSAYFTSSSFGEALILNEGETNKYNFEQTLIAENGMYAELIYQYFIGLDSFTLDLEYLVYYEDTMQISGGMDFEMIADIDGSYPSDIEWEEGATKSFNLCFTSIKRRSWDTGTSDWEEWEDVTADAYSLSGLNTFTHCGSFIISYDDLGLFANESSWQAQKNLSIK